MTRPVSTVAAVLWTLLVIVLLLLPGASMPQSELLHFDKAVHALLFGVGVFLWLRVPWDSKPVRWAIVLGAVAFAPASEFLQHMLVKGRTGDPMDAVADVIGVVLGTAVWLIVRRIRGNRNDDHPDDLTASVRF